ncbi:hypothetical protein D046_0527A, partial [Vibrio parahaemolyticus V-223/04]
MVYQWQHETFFSYNVVKY